jgi:NADPH-dependent 2,4-dienoyl-CoA reductase/sulfur reductase-like enzyme
MTKSDFFSSLLMIIIEILFRLVNTREEVLWTAFLKWIYTLGGTGTIRGPKSEFPVGIDGRESFPVPWKVLMTYYAYLIAGGGMTADAAVRGIRAVDPKGTIGLFSQEPDPPYKRPLLSKGLWLGKPVEQAWLRTENLGLDLHLATGIVAIDPRRKHVRDDRGGEHSYGKMLLATGGSPRRLGFGEKSVIYYRTMRDYQRLRNSVERGRRYAVIGGGFIGSEIAAALAINGKEVVLIFPDSGICSRVFPEDISRFLNRSFREKGVELLAGESVEGIADGPNPVLKLKTKGDLPVDGVIAGIGIRPNIDLARAAGLEIRDGGIAVDEGLRTSAPGVYAAGDVASFHNSALDTFLRVEHEDNALRMGEAAGHAMAGEAVRYLHLPYFYSDLFDAGYEAVGELDPQSEIFADWTEPYKKGVVYYLKAGRVRGVLAWNIFGLMEQARRLIAEPGPIQPAGLNGRLTG